MTAIVVKTFNGLKPIAHPRLLSQSDAQLSQNVRLISGALAPLKQVTTLKALTLTAPKTIFRYGTSATETQYWLEFLNDTNVMRSPIAQDQWDRLYWTDGVNEPRYATNSMITTGATFPGSYYKLGIPAPTTAITYGAYSTVPTYTVVTREYVLTFYNPTTTKESIPGDIFTVQAVDGYEVAFSELTTDNNGDSGITKKRLYRKLSGTFKRVVELDLATTTYSDTTTDATLASNASLSASIAAAPDSPEFAPTVSAPSVTLTSAINRQYVYTIKNYLVDVGDYSPIVYPESTASAAVTISADDTQTVTIGGLSNNLTGTHFRLYRKDAGTSAYRFVAEVPVSQTSIADPIGTTVLGNPLETQHSSTPTGTLTASATTSTAPSTVTRVYMVSYVDASSVESARSPASSIVTAVDGQTTVSITHNESLGSGISKKRLYRQNVPANGTVTEANWRLVAEVTASTTSWTDVATAASLTTSYSSSLQGLPASPWEVPVRNSKIPAKVIPESRTYVYTYVSAYGEEGPPSPASAVIEVDPAGSVAVTVPGAAPAGNYNITLKRIYRSSSSGTQSSFQFLAEIPVATTSYSDTTKQENLGEVIPSENWFAPPTGLSGLKMMANGVAVGFKDKTLYFSEPYLPHAWPHEYPVDDTIIGIGVFGQSVVALTMSYPYLFNGIDPAAMSSNKMTLPQACAAKRSIIETGDGVVYASPDGLVSIGSNTGLLTQQMISREQWQAYVPSSMESYTYNGRVFVTYNTGSARGVLAFDLSGQGAALTTSDLNASTAVSGGYYDARSDTLYLAQGTNIVRFDRGSAMTMTWRSKVFRMVKQENFSFGQVRAAAYPVTFKVWADGVLKHTQTVANERPFRLPAGFRALEWEFQIEGTNEVTEVFITTSAAELRTE